MMKSPPRIKRYRDEALENPYLSMMYGTFGTPVKRSHKKIKKNSDGIKKNLMATFSDAADSNK